MGYSISIVNLQCPVQGRRQNSFKLDSFWCLFKAFKSIPHHRALWDTRPFKSIRHKSQKWNTIPHRSLFWDTPFKVLIEAPVLKSIPHKSLFWDTPFGTGCHGTGAKEHIGARFRYKSDRMRSCKACMDHSVGCASLEIVCAVRSRTSVRRA